MPYDITRTELVWPGKYDENGKRPPVERTSLPFQVIERVNESRATREAEKERKPTLFDVWKGDEGETFEDGWRNKLIWGENRLVMSSLLEQFAGKIDLIYIDPPFLTGADFRYEVEVGEDALAIEKEQSSIEEKAYRDTWNRGLDTYLSMLADRLPLARTLLSGSGTLYVHMGVGMAGYVQALLDEEFGRESMLNQITWQYKYGGRSKDAFGRKHDVIFRYGKTPDAYFDLDAVRVPVEDASLETNYRYVDESGRRYRKGVWKSGKEYRYYADEGRTPDDVWSDVNSIHAASGERIGYPTQKPEALLQRIVAASCPPGGLVADFFCGSGTTMAVAEKTGRRWIGCDLGRYSVHVSRKRMLGIEACRPFEVLNLGKYERQYWSVATFGEDLDEDGVIALWEYFAFILKLYGASPTTGLQNLQGKIANAYVHIGSVDSPVTIGEIDDAVGECIALKGKELHVLGWEWEMGLHDPMTEQAAARGVKLVLRQIPREVMEAQAVESGDIQFFELAYLDVDVRPTKRKREYTVALTDFVIPNPELVPDDVREKITKWSDYVDYWAVDWNFAEDTFMQGWVTYRTRKDRTLSLKSDPHVYDELGDYSVMVKVIDVFGNDTSKIIPLTVS